MPNVIVLRDRQGTQNTWNNDVAGAVLGTGRNLKATRFSHPAIVPPEPYIETGEVDGAEFSGLAQDPHTIAIARSMPTTLISPLRKTTGTVAEPHSWGIEAVRGVESEFSGSGAVVAVLDTGIDSRHKAFAGLTLTIRDFSGHGGLDVNGHGTHCAGTILGRDLAGTRIGVARGVSKALIGKVLRNDGRGSSEALFDAICWASQEGADVVAMSLGFDFAGKVTELIQDGWTSDVATSVALEGYRGNLRLFDALMMVIQAREAFGSGPVVVAACGNESRRDVDPSYEVAMPLPAAAEGVVSVGAVGEERGALMIGTFSNTFPRVVAPGIDILSACAGGGTIIMSGTSMACPHAAGVAALWWEYIRRFGLPPRPTTVISRILASARPQVFAPDVGWKLRGAGLVTAP